MRTTPVIAGNWKMHKGPAEAQRFLREFLDLHTQSDVPVIFFPPAISLQAAAHATGDRPDVRIGVQNVHWEAEGAFTGETSVGMARDAGAGIALIGHSERRHVFAESDQEVARKVTAALRGGLDAMVCVGETIDERRAGLVAEVILRQLDAALDAVEAEAEGPGGGEAGNGDALLGRLFIAYEPVWAIGTGETATPADAASAHSTLRERLRDRNGSAGGAVPILYGGSVKPENAAELLAADDVDGVLVGGASLDPASFARIAAAGRG